MPTTRNPCQATSTDHHRNQDTPDPIRVFGHTAGRSVSQPRGAGQQVRRKCYSFYLVRQRSDRFIYFLFLVTWFQCHNEFQQLCLLTGDAFSTHNDSYRHILLYNIHVSLLTLIISFMWLFLFSDSYFLALLCGLMYSFQILIIYAVHYMDANKTAGEEARRQLHKNAASNTGQVLVATPHKTQTIRPLASHHENYPS